MKLIFDNLKFDFNFLLENAPLMLKLLAIVRKVDIVKSHDYSIMLNQPSTLWT